MGEYLVGRNANKFFKEDEVNKVFIIADPRFNLVNLEDEKTGDFYLTAKSLIHAPVVLGSRIVKISQELDQWVLKDKTKISYFAEVNYN